MEEDRKNLMSHVTVLLSQYHELLTQTIDDKEHFHEEEKVFYEVSKVIHPKFALGKVQVFYEVHKDYKIFTVNLTFT